MKHSDPKQRNSQARSSSWILAITVFLVIYFLLQRPPGEQADRVAEPVVDQQSEMASDESVGQTTVLSTEQSSALEKEPHQGSQARPQDASSDSGIARSGSVSASKGKQTPANSNRPPPETTESAEKTKPQLGKLRSVGEQVWESTAGLKYGPGSREKHRLKHVMRHAVDQPGRPGKHGVFSGNGEQDAVLALIDEAYLQALRGGPHVQKKQEGKRVVYTVNMGRPVGYVGGQVGKKQGHPAARQIRLVLEGASIITAFPL